MAKANIEAALRCADRIRKGEMVEGDYCPLDGEVVTLADEVLRFREYVERIDSILDFWESEDAEAMNAHDAARWIGRFK